MSTYQVKLTGLNDDGEHDRYGRNRLIIERDGVCLFDFRDGGEHEDQTLTRDWCWVADALMQAYQYGYLDGTEELANKIADEIAARRAGEHL